MPTSSQGRVLLGRRSESEALAGLLEAVRGGNNRALVLPGEAGVGKTALLEHALEQRQGFVWPAPRVCNPKWSSRSLACISCARRCWIDSSLCQILSTMHFAALDEQEAVFFGPAARAQSTA